jgi:hypothetical protein
METFSGRRFFPFDPRPEDIDIVDIAHALSMTCRYGGHAKQFYSVAQHSVLVASKAPAHLALRALLHDAAEAYIGDLIRPIKKDDRMAAFHDIERSVEHAICVALDVPWPLLTPEIKALDNRILLDEREAVMSASGHDWKVEGEPLGVHIDLWAPTVAKWKFLDAYDRYRKWSVQLEMAV